MKSKISKTKDGHNKSKEVMDDNEDDLTIGIAYSVFRVQNLWSRSPIPKFNQHDSAATNNLLNSQGKIAIFVLITRIKQHSNRLLYHFHACNLNLTINLGVKFYHTASKANLASCVCGSHNSTESEGDKDSSPTPPHNQSIMVFPVGQVKWRYPPRLPIDLKPARLFINKLVKIFIDHLVLTSIGMQHCIGSFFNVVLYRVFNEYNYNDNSRVNTKSADGHSGKPNVHYSPTGSTSRMVQTDRRTYLGSKKYSNSIRKTNQSHNYESFLFTPNIRHCLAKIRVLIGGEESQSSSVKRIENHYYNHPTRIPDATSTTLICVDGNEAKNFPTEIFSSAGDNKTVVSVNIDMPESVNERKFQSTGSSVKLKNPSSVFLASNAPDSKSLSRNFESQNKVSRFIESDTEECVIDNEMFQTFSESEYSANAQDADWYNQHSNVMDSQKSSVQQKSYYQRTKSEEVVHFNELDVSEYESKLPNPAIKLVKINENGENPQRWKSIESKQDFVKVNSNAETNTSFTEVKSESKRKNAKNDLKRSSRESAGRESRPEWFDVKLKKTPKIENQPNRSKMKDDTGGENVTIIKVNENLMSKNFTETDEIPKNSNSVKEILVIENFDDYQDVSVSKKFKIMEKTEYIASSKQVSKDANRKFTDKNQNRFQDYDFDKSGLNSSEPRVPKIVMPTAITKESSRKHSMTSKSSSINSFRNSETELNNSVDDGPEWISLSKNKKMASIDWENLESQNKNSNYILISPKLRQLKEISNTQTTPDFKTEDDNDTNWQTEEIQIDFEQLNRRYFQQDSESISLDRRKRVSFSEDIVIGGSSFQTTSSQESTSQFSHESKVNQRQYESQISSDTDIQEQEEEHRLTVQNPTGERNNWILVSQKRKDVNIDWENLHRNHEVVKSENFDDKIRQRQVKIVENGSGIQNRAVTIEESERSLLVKENFDMNVKKLSNEHNGHNIEEQKENDEIFMLHRINLKPTSATKDDSGRPGLVVISGNSEKISDDSTLDIKLNEYTSPKDHQINQRMTDTQDIIEKLEQSDHLKYFKSPVMDDPDQQVDAVTKKMKFNPLQNYIPELKELENVKLNHIDSGNTFAFQNQNSISYSFPNRNNYNNKNVAEDAELTEIANEKALRANIDWDKLGSSHFSNSEDTHFEKLKLKSVHRHKNLENDGGFQMPKLRHVEMNQDKGSTGIMIIPKPGQKTSHEIISSDSNMPNVLEIQKSPDPQVSDEYKYKQRRDLNISTSKDTFLDLSGSNEQNSNNNELPSVKGHLKLESNRFSNSEDNHLEKLKHKPVHRHEKLENDGGFQIPKLRHVETNQEKGSTGIIIIPEPEQKTPHKIISSDSNMPKVLEIEKTPDRQVYNEYEQRQYFDIGSSQNKLSNVSGSNEQDPNINKLSSAKDQLKLENRSFSNSEDNNLEKIKLKPVHRHKKLENDGGFQIPKLRHVELNQEKGSKGVIFIPEPEQKTPHAIISSDSNMPKVLEIEKSPDPQVFNEDKQKQDLDIGRTPKDKFSNISGSNEKDLKTKKLPFAKDHLKLENKSFSNSEDNHLEKLKLKPVHRHEKLKNEGGFQIPKLRHVELDQEKGSTGIIIIPELEQKAPYKIISSDSNMPKVLKIEKTPDRQVFNEYEQRQYFVIGPSQNKFSNVSGSNEQDPNINKLSSAEDQLKLENKSFSNSEDNLLEKIKLKPVHRHEKLENDGGFQMPKLRHVEMTQEKDSTGIISISEPDQKTQHEIISSDSNMPKVFEIQYSPDLQVFNEYKQKQDLDIGRTPNDKFSNVSGSNEQDLKNNKLSSENDYLKLDEKSFSNSEDNHLEKIKLKPVHRHEKLENEGGFQIPKLRHVELDQEKGSTGIIIIPEPEQKTPHSIISSDSNMPNVLEIEKSPDLQVVNEDKQKQDLDIGRTPRHKFSNVSGSNEQDLKNIKLSSANDYLKLENKSFSNSEDNYLEKIKLKPVHRHEQLENDGGFQIPKLRHVEMNQEKGSTDIIIIPEPEQKAPHKIISSGSNMPKVLMIEKSPDRQVVNEYEQRQDFDIGPSQNKFSNVSGSNEQDPNINNLPSAKDHLKLENKRFSNSEVLEKLKLKPVHRHEKLENEGGFQIPKLRHVDLDQEKGSTGIIIIPEPKQKTPHSIISSDSNMPKVLEIENSTDSQVVNEDKQKQDLDTGRTPKHKFSNVSGSNEQDLKNNKLSSAKDQLKLENKSFSNSEDNHLEKIKLKPVHRHEKLENDGGFQMPKLRHVETNQEKNSTGIISISEPDQKTQHEIISSDSNMPKVFEIQYSPDFQVFNEDKQKQDLDIGGTPKVKFSNVSGSNEQDPKINKLSSAKDHLKLENKSFSNSEDNLLEKIKLKPVHRHEKLENDGGFQMPKLRHVEMTQEKDSTGIISIPELDQKTQHEIISSDSNMPKVFEIQYSPDFQVFNEDKQKQDLDIGRTLKHKFSNVSGSNEQDPKINKLSSAKDHLKLENKSFSNSEDNLLEKLKLKPVHRYEKLENDGGFQMPKLRHVEMNQEKGSTGIIIIPEPEQKTLHAIISIDSNMPTVLEIEKSPDPQVFNEYEQRQDFDIGPSQNKFSNVSGSNEQDPKNNKLPSAKDYDELEVIEIKFEDSEITTPKLSKADSRYVPETENIKLNHVESEKAHTFQNRNLISYPLPNRNYNSNQNSADDTKELVKVANDKASRDNMDWDKLESKHFSNSEENLFEKVKLKPVHRNDKLENNGSFKIPKLRHVEMSEKNSPTEAIIISESGIILPNEIISEDKNMPEALEIERAPDPQVFHEYENRQDTGTSKENKNWNSFFPKEYPDVSESKENNSRIDILPFSREQNEPEEFEDEAIEAIEATEQTSPKSPLNNSLSLKNQKRPTKTHTSRENVGCSEDWISLSSKRRSKHIDWDNLDSNGDRKFPENFEQVHLKSVRSNNPPKSLSEINLPLLNNQTKSDSKPDSATNNQNNTSINSMGSIPTDIKDIPDQNLRVQSTIEPTEKIIQNSERQINKALETSIDEAGSNSNFTNNQRKTNSDINQSQDSIKEGLHINWDNLGSNKTENSC
ncbi:hypothetical protein GQR58_017375 [Nymphon striatum]|nr:hypothetical protein GQR58_017375 [Nymphon striatum]